jgi:ribosome-associated protein
MFHVAIRMPRLKHAARPRSIDPRLFHQGTKRGLAQPAPAPLFSQMRDQVARVMQVKSHPMPSAAALRPAPPPDVTSHQTGSKALADTLVGWLDDAKAEDIVPIDIAEKSSIADVMIVASGRTDRHVSAIAQQLRDKLKSAGYERVRIEGQPQCDWVLIDAGDVIVHVLRPEVRAFYNLEKMWLADRPGEPASH